MSLEEAVAFHGVGLRASGAAARWLQAFLGKLEGRAEASERVITFDVDEVASTTPPPLGSLHFEAPRFRAYGSKRGVVLTTERSWVEVSSEPPYVRGQLSRCTGSADFELLHVALLIALRAHHIFELHAAALCDERGAVLLVGPSGSGKSTTALALVSAGLSYLGDDRVLYRAHGDELELLSYPTAFRATTATLTSFPDLQAYAARTDYLGKHPIDVARAFPGQHRTSFRGTIDLLFPRIGPATKLGELSQQAAFEGLLEQSGSLVFEGHTALRTHLSVLKQLVGRSRRLSLTLGPEWLADPSTAARTLLEKLRA